MINKTPQELYNYYRSISAFKNRYFKRLVESSIEWTISVDSSKKLFMQLGEISLKSQARKELHATNRTKTRRREGRRK
jgi:hypothetical protein